ncbi:hypothetical protein AMS68_004888 [Peltaster fructicola]|uniref:DNA-directed RNA polymerase III subunit Rpc5 n=1 Tax=Peltaster fructicola TaxID=286661 RepID=A0A6H0XXI5_9PEZI|nr:hypothetical protein AMS68_004888 [Peltaster fructicola]
MATKDDPVIAEYDVFITPALQEQIYLLQYLNRPREKPYSERLGARPENVRVKAKSGFLEMDIDMHTDYNFNRYQSLKWGDAVQTGKTLQNSTATYGPASGFAVPRVRQPSRGLLKDKVERENEIFNGLTDFSSATHEGKALSSQTLGGKIIRQESTSDMAQPAYFVGAFRGNALHLSKVHGTVQMRPQFHHVDAEEQRNRVAASRVAATEADASRPAPPARALQQSYKDLNDDKDKDAPERKLRKMLQNAEEEEWASLQYVDEQEDLAFDTFNRCMFVPTETAKPLKSELTAEKYLDQVSLPRQDIYRRKKRPPRKKGTIELDGEEEY